MTAIRVVDDHTELDSIGVLTHNQIDNHVTGTAFIVVSGSGALPALGRRLKAGPGITIFDEGPGGNLIISGSVSPGASQISWMEVPSGSNNGTNLNFILQNVPVPSSSLMFFINGVLQAQGPTSDYVIVSGTTVHINHRYRPDSNLFATYPY